MKELLKQYAAYNLWAHQKLLDAILALPEEKHLAEVPSSFNSLLKTVLHTWDAESIWWQRMKLQEHIMRPSENFSGTMQDAASGLQNQSRLWEEWISNASDLSLEHVFQYQTTKREVIKMPIYQMVHHVFNHGTYHRGQLVNMMRQLGADKIPGTDFAFWLRNKK
jgi:uncharacterized damage-inducible protein DinB